MATVTLGVSDWTEDAFLRDGPKPIVQAIPLATGGSDSTFVNAAFDVVANADVYWNTPGADDLASGSSYPGPGTFDPAAGGADTRDHRIHHILQSGE